MTIKQYVTAMMLISLSLLVSSCVTTDNVNELQRQITQLNDEIDILNKRSLDTKATTGANYETVMEEVKILRGSFEENQHQFDQKSEEITILKEVVNRSISDIENRLFAIEQRLTAIETKLGTMAALEPAGGSPKPGTTETDVPDNRTTTTTSDVKPTGEELYTVALKKFQDNDFDGAARDFRDFIKTSPESSLADNAQFWIGECYYAQKDFERAILEYDTVVKRYPSADKVSSAMLKEGFAFLELGDKIHAKAVFSELIKKYPKESQAEIAKKKLEGL